MNEQSALKRFFLTCLIFFVAILLVPALLKAYPTTTDKPSEESDQEAGAIENSEPTFQISLDAELTQNHSVGDDWRTSFKYGFGGLATTELADGESVTFQSSFPLRLAFSSYACEQDTYPDIASHASTRILTEEDLASGEQVVTHTLTVTEDQGRFAGNTATWRVSFHISQIQ